MRGVVEAVKGSLVAKVFIICFLAIHLPLIALMFYLGLGRPADPVPILVVALLATLLGAVLSYLAVFQLVSPIDRLVSAMDRYQTEGIEPFVDVKGTDGVKRLADKILDLVRSQEKSLSVLRRQANSDPLTGLGNRRWLQNAVSIEINRAARRSQWVWVIAFDLDRFKEINDRYGHAAGDEVLMIIAEATQRQLRPYDLIARIGGEEFCVVSTDDSDDFGLKAAERIRSAIEAWRPRLGNDTITITASFGVHKGDPVLQSFSEMLRLADENLYQAKAKGRNQVVGLQR
ncbi:diguanylate cyclase (GGDEF) domain-containing protein [Devosia crocina]|uniref:diguanylate cyclase n=1 Tax=Devosia crocina TaxID=429728 RepID=A0A1I7NNF2_9HYPH|nr:GGDEF domain-containing protein [Devosia crocina]SFV36149.1 diguanylate cyclase (GGDEF) domain-containing protein [Devosia crocina]